MIVFDDESTPLKGGPVSAEPVPFEDAPPAYSPQYGTDQIVPPRRRLSRRRRRRLRLCASAAFIITLTTLLAWNYVDPSSLYRRWWVRPILENPAFPELEEKHCLKHAAWQRTVAHAESHDHRSSEQVSGASFLLPSSGLMFLTSRGLATGKVEVLNSGLTGQNARVYITAHYPANRQFKLGRKAVVCTLQSGTPGQYGIGIFTSEEKDHGEDFYFHVSVLLPFHFNSTYTPAYNLDINLSRFSAVFLTDTGFSSLSVKTTNGAIVADDLIVVNGNLETSNAPIQGKFNASSSLRLATSKAPIDAEIILVNSAADDPATLDIETTHYDLGASITLMSQHPPRNPSGGNFSIRASSQQGGLVINFPSSTPEPYLDIYATSSGKSAMINLPAAFEGAYSLRALESTSPQVLPVNIMDPSSRNRPRIYNNITSTYDESLRAHQVDGTVYWAGTNALRGQVNITTTNSSLYMML